MTKITNCIIISIEKSYFLHLLIVLRFLKGSQLIEMPLVLNMIKQIIDLQLWLKQVSNWGRILIVDQVFSMTNAEITATWFHLFRKNIFISVVRLHQRWCLFLLFWFLTASLATQSPFTLLTIVPQHTLCCWAVPFTP